MRKTDNRTVFYFVGMFSVFLGLTGFRHDAYADYSASMATDGTVQISATGKAVGTDNIHVNTNCPTGYNITISGGEDNNLYKDGDNTSEYYIAPSSGTVADPVAFQDKTWGYSISSSTAEGKFIGNSGSDSAVSNALHPMCHGF